MTFKRHATLLLSALSLILSLGVLCLTATAFLDPTSSSLAMVGTTAWTTYGPHLFLAAVASFVLALLPGVLLRQVCRPLVPAVALAACLGSGFIVFQIVWATVAAGGSFNPVASLLLGDMEAPPPDAVETIRIVDGTVLRAAIYRPRKAVTPAPTIVYVHGGGFMTGHRTETAADLDWFAANGWLVVSIDYRLFGPGNATWDKAMPDAACGLIWAQRNAARFGGDPRRIALVGDSAGGNLAINIGFAAATGMEVAECGGRVPVPMAIATQYPAVDPISIYGHGFPIPGFEPRMLIEGYIGGAPAEHPDRVAAISSRTYLTPKAPPTLVILPASDSLVVADGTLDFINDARTAGVNIDFVQLPFANHIYNQIAANSLGNQAGRTIRMRFLENSKRVADPKSEPAEVNDAHIEAPTSRPR